MSQIYSMRSARLFWLIAASLVVVGTANAAEDEPTPRGAPGILIEPQPRGGEDGDRREQVPPNDHQRRDSERPGCPVNNRPLELLV